MRKTWLVVGSACVLALGLGCGSDDPPQMTNVAVPGTGTGTGTGDGTGVGTGTGDGTGVVGDGTGVVGDGTGGGAGDGAGTGDGSGTGDGTGATGGTGLPPGWETSRGQCGINSGYPGDEACLLPPPAEDGIQIHVGPADYANGAIVQPFIMSPGGENTQCFNFKMPNSEQFFYQGWEMSGRPGTHHIINTMVSSNHPDGFAGTVNSPGTCDDGGTGTSPTRIGGLPGASKAFMPRGPVAPENATLGAPIPGGNVQAQADMHYFNITDADIIREFWLNMYYIPADQVTEQAIGIRAMGGLEWLFAPIPANSRNVYQYTCAGTGTEPGRIVMLLGHTHAHGVRETAWINGTKVFEQFDYLDPKIYYYDSITENPDFAPGAAGAMSGIINVNPGDVFEWECDINNDSNVALRYTNEVYTGEMCNMWGSSVNVEFNCLSSFF